MGTPLRVLILEDNPSDAELMLHTLRRAGYDPTGECVETERDFRDRLGPSVEVILSDFSMPSFDALRALEVMHERRLDIPFILVSGSVGEERAVQVMQNGASDYIIKDRMGRLGLAVTQALERRASAATLSQERRLAEEALQKSESLVRELTAHIHQVLWVVDAIESKVAYVSDGYEELWGRSCQSLLDNPRTYMEGIHPADLDQWRRADAAMYETGHIDTEFRVLRPDGSVRWVWSRGSPVRENGRVVRIVGVVEDVTEKKLLAAERDALLARLQLQIERMPLAYLLSGPDMRYTRWNPAAERMFGFFEAEVLGRHPCDTVVPPQSVDLVNGIFARLMAGDMNAHGVSENVTRAGRTITCEWHNTPVFDAANTFQGVLSLAQDITERRRAEVTLALRDRAIQAVKQGILITDPNQPDNPIIYASPGFLQMTGYAADEVLGRNCRFLQGRATDPGAVARLREAVKQKRPCTVELLNYRKDGTPFWNELSVSPVQDATGRLTHFVGAEVDVTERRLLEEQLRQSQKMDAVGQLAGGVAHDFNNLLTIINGYSDLVLSQAPEGTETWEFAREINRAGGRAAALTQQLLAFSRKQVLETKVLSLNAIVADTDRMLRRLIGEDVSVSAVLAPDLGHVRADPGQIEQVIINLAVNARDAMPRGGRLTIETANAELDPTYTQTRPDLRPGPYVLLAMTDTGTGMDAATRARIFEPFFTTKLPGKGTGLGLATVFGIIKQSGGHLDVYTEVGRGTTFKIYLPRVEPVPGSGAVAPRKPRAAPGTQTILLAEDEPALRALASRILGGHGYRVVEASNGESALSAAEAFGGTIHLLVTDVVMPGMSGRQLAERLVAVRPAVKVLYVSGYTDDAVVRHGILQAETPFLQKPFTPAALIQKVAEVMG
ncbi:PAS domain S-box protein [Gemmata sp.]|uniref:PAS domain S-box protein n=1 Tax=Gemmata sp. TaxID=1914242 RepID=UPI003F711CBC